MSSKSTFWTNIKLLTQDVPSDACYKTLTSLGEASLHASCTWKLLCNQLVQIMGKMIENSFGPSLVKWLKHSIEGAKQELFLDNIRLHLHTECIISFGKSTKKIHLSLLSVSLAPPASVGHVLTLFGMLLIQTASRRPYDKSLGTQQGIKDANMKLDTYIV